MLRVTETGIVTERLDEIHARIVEKFKGIYGQDIIVTPDSPDGQMIGLISKELADINEVISAIVQMLDPYQATGAYLDQRALYAGIIRKGGEYSYLRDVVITDRPSAIIPVNTVLIDSNRVRWLTTRELALDENGSGRVEARSEDRGAFSLSENQSLQFEVMLADSMRATSITEAAPGRIEEMDSNLLLRFMMSHAINNEDDRDGIRAALLNIPEVKKAVVLENPEGFKDKETGLPQHSINAILVGGEPNDIALALLRKKKGGATFFGQEEYVIRYKDMNRRARWDYAGKVKIAVTLEYERLKPLTDLAEKTISDTLMAHDFDIHENVFAQKLVCGINNDPNFILTSIKVNGGERVNIGWRQYAAILSVEISISN